MADTKITALTALTAADPANDVLPIVDVSDTTMAASGTTKKISVNNILGASGTATLASATITGDLTVNSNVNVGASPAFYGGKIATNGSIAIAGGNYLKLWNSTGTGVAGINAGAADTLTFSLTNAFTTAMTLNSTGLGIGASPTDKLSVNGGASFSGFGINANPLNPVSTSQRQARFQNTGGDFYFGIESSSAGGFFPGSTAYATCFYNATATPLQFFTNGSLKATIDTSGNVGIGVTPSAWNSSYRGLQLGAGGAISAHTSASLPWLVATSNSFINSAGDWKFINNGYSTRYLARGDDGTQSWWTSNNGSAGGTVAYTQAMTLDASGNLLVGKTATNLQVVGCELKANGTVFSTLVDTTNAAASSYQLYSTGAATYRFYVGMGGTVFATNTTISGISDARLKENVQDIDVGLGAILALKPRKFDWKAGKGKDIKGDRGFIAQEFETVFPNLIDEWKDAAPEGEAPYKSVRQDLIPVLVKAIQELAARVQTLETR